MISIDEYLKDKPNAMLSEYKEYMDKACKEEIVKEFNRRNKSEQWYKEQEGKWFIIKFSNNAYRIAQFSDNKQTKHYVVWPSKNDYEFRCHLCYFNKSWLNNPYENVKSDNKIVELTKAQVDIFMDIVDRYSKELYDCVLDIKELFK